MKKQRFPAILLFLIGFLIIGACEKFEDPPLNSDQPFETIEEEKPNKTLEEAGEYKKDQPGLSEV